MAEETAAKRHALGPHDGEEDEPDLEERPAQEVGDDQRRALEEGAEDPLAVHAPDRKRQVEQKRHHDQRWQHGHERSERAPALEAHHRHPHHAVEGVEVEREHEVLAQGRAPVEELEQEREERDQEQHQVRPVARGGGLQPPGEALGVLGLEALEVRVEGAGQPPGGLRRFHRPRGLLALRLPGRRRRGLPLPVRRLVVREADGDRRPGRGRLAVLDLDLPGRGIPVGSRATSTK